MADIEFGETVEGGNPLGGSGVTGIVNWIAAFVSVALLAGLANWGYQLMVRDVSGVPVVRALEGPMRVAPEDPGGLAADHQGLAVNNIAAVGQAEAPASRLVLAPKPTILTPEDQTAGALNAQPAAQSTADTAGANAQAGTQNAASGQASLIEAALRQVEGESTAPPTRTDVISASVAGVSRSLRPMVRPVFAQPETVAPVALTQPAPVVSAPISNVKSIDPANVPVGTRLAQLGAYETSEIAQAEWLKVAARFDDVMADKTRLIEQAQSGGKVFYRLRAYGFSDLSDARRFCSALLAGQANCIPVVTR